MSHGPHVPRVPQTSCIISRESVEGEYSPEQLVMGQREAVSREKKSRESSLAGSLLTEYTWDESHSLGHPVTGEAGNRSEGDRSKWSWGASHLLERSLPKVSPLDLSCVSSRTLSRQLGILSLGSLMGAQWSPMLSLKCSSEWMNL